MTTLIKICGINSAAALDAALDARADFVGFVFFPPSPRHISFELARRLGAQVAGRARKVALTVDCDDATHAAIMESLAPDLLQLHGREGPERVAELRRRFSRPVIKALPVGAKNDIAAARDYGMADWLLFDARAPKEATRPGGLGRPFDWTLLRGIDAKQPFMLSGGLDRANVAEAMRVAHAAAVDVSSGVEEKPGVKDPARIAAFVRAVRAADAGASANECEQCA